MDIRLQVAGTAEVQEALRSLKASIQNKAVVRWTNWLGIEAQGEMRQKIPARFSFRGTAEGFRKAIVFQQATASGERKRQAVLRVGGPGFGQSRTQNLGLILARHEEASTRTNAAQTFFDGRGRAMTGLGFFIPAAGLRTANTNPPRQMYPSAIGAALRSTPDQRVILAKGTKKGTKRKGSGVSFFATRKGIFRRKHSLFGQADIEPIWFFSSKVRTPARLGLWDTARKVLETRAVPLGLQAIDETIHAEWLRSLQVGAPKRLG